MSYEHPRFPTYYRFLFANADANRGYIGPKGVKGRLIDYGFEAVTTTFTNTTTGPQASFGTVGDRDAVGEEFDVGALTTSVPAKSVLSTYSKPADIATYILGDGALAADTLYFLYAIAATGGSPAGAGTCFALVHWGA